MSGSPRVPLLTCLDCEQICRTFLYDNVEYKYLKPGLLFSAANSYPLPYWKFRHSAKNLVCCECFTRENRWSFVLSPCISFHTSIKPLWLIQLRQKALELFYCQLWTGFCVPIHPTQRERQRRTIWSWNETAKLNSSAITEARIRLYICHNSPQTASSCNWCTAARGRLKISH